jgi:hypothetical protein
MCCGARCVCLWVQEAYRQQAAAGRDADDGQRCAPI